MRWAAARLALASAAKRRAACFKSAPLAQVSSRLLEGLGFGGVVVTEVYRDSFSQVKELANSLSYTKKAFETPIS